MESIHNTQFLYFIKYFISLQFYCLQEVQFGHISIDPLDMLVDYSQLGIHLRLCIWWKEYIHALQSLSSLQKKKKMLHHMTLRQSKGSVSICIKVCSFYYLNRLHKSLHSSLGVGMQRVDYFKSLYSKANQQSASLKMKLPNVCCQ